MLPRNNSGIRASACWVFWNVSSVTQKENRRYLSIRLSSEQKELIGIVANKTFTDSTFSTRVLQRSRATLRMRSPFRKVQFGDQVGRISNDEKAAFWRNGFKTTSFKSLTDTKSLCCVRLSQPFIVICFTLAFIRKVRKQLVMKSGYPSAWTNTRQMPSWLTHHDCVRAEIFTSLINPS